MQGLVGHGEASGCHSNHNLGEAWEGFQQE